MNCTFWTIEKSRLGETAWQKLFTWRKFSLPWDITCVEVRWMHSLINDMLLQSEIHYFAEISLRWNISPRWDCFSHINSSIVTSRYFNVGFMKLVVDEENHKLKIYILNKIIKDKDNAQNRQKDGMVAKRKLKSCYWFKSSRPDVFCKKDVLRNFAKFTGKHLCQSLYFNKVAGLRPATLLK